MLLAYMLSDTLSAQHTIYPDLFIIGSDSLMEGLVVSDIVFVFDVTNGGFSGGRNFNTSWHRDSIGLASFSFGANTVASGSIGATALGAGTEASGDSGATALGVLTEASGNIGATALGNGTVASGDDGATALGSRTEASGDNGATALGRRTEASGGDGATALGNFTVASGGGGATALGDLTVASGGIGATALGAGTEASGDVGATALGVLTEASGNFGATALGRSTIANGNSGLVLGQYNDTLVHVGYDEIDKPLLIVGNGTTPSARSNAVVVRQTGEVGIGENDPDAYLHIKKPNSLNSPQLKLTGDGGDSFVRIEVNREGINKSWFHSVTTNNTDASSFYSFAYEPTPGSFVFPIRMDGVGHTAFGKLPGTNRIEVNGNASKSTAGDWLANSDRRIKTDIQDIDNSFELMRQLRPVKFKYSDEWKQRNPSIKDQYYYNFIAQEYQEVFPEAVKGSGEYLENDREEILQIDTYNAQVVTIAAVKELIEENKQLRADNRRLYQKYASLEARIKSIENQESSSISSE